MLTLKLYQERSLEALKTYLQRSVAPSSSAKLAFIEITERPYRSVDVLPGRPYVCLRIPTGGGKTLVAAYASAIAITEYMRADRGVVLWLVPSNVIKDQTLATLREPNHPYRQALQTSLGGGPITVMDLAEALYVQRSVLDGETCVIISTLAALRVENTEGRKVYETAGALQHHFTGLSALLEARLERDGNGVIAYSLANVLRLRRPVVIMDEAHNARTTLSFDVLARFAPSCIVEFTATPETKHRPEAGYFASNVLHHVSAAELKAEQMIKLPIRLQLQDDWKEVLAAAIVMRDGLEKDAKEEQKATEEYLRPILLVQAQPKSKLRATLTVDVVRQALLDDLKVPESWIKVATGDTRELDGIDLGATDCDVRVIITVQALKEGWDCPFAYVLCSVAELSSGTAVEQILGRILRMPQAREKRHITLNRAYAFVGSRNFADAATKLQDALVENGFERFDAAAMIDSDEAPSLFGDPLSLFAPQAVVTVTNAPDTSILLASLRAKVSYDAERGILSFIGPMEEEEREALKRCVSTPEDHAAVEKLYIASRKPVVTGPLSPAQRGEAFCVPRLGIRVDGQLELFDESHLLDNTWKLSAYPAMLSELEFSTEAREPQAADIDVSEEGKIETRYVSDLQSQLSLLSPAHAWSIPELAGWLDRKIAHPDLTLTESGLFLHRLLTYLVEERKIPIDKLGRDQFRLRDAAEAKIASLRLLHRHTRLQLLLDLGAKSPFEVQPSFSFSYDPRNYPANEWYSGGYQFQKHYYPRVGELKSEGEEFRCAQTIDMLKEVRYWVRNLERQPQASFWLQTSTDRFYPDFVALLEDGRLLVVEYKGEIYITNDDSKEKRAVGDMWAERSNGKAVFLMVTQKTLGEIQNAVRADA
jgi:type III restriction enzyme